MTVNWNETEDRIATKRRYEKIQCCVLTAGVIPIMFLAQIISVQACTFNRLLGIYGFINVYGNMLMSILTDTRVRSYRREGAYCEVCKLHRPADSWHCPTCNVCVLRSDHHCVFLSHCVGRNNYRYYVCFFFHLSIALIYSICFYVYYLASDVLNFFEELARGVIPPVENFSLKHYKNYHIVFFMTVDAFVLPIALILFFYHMRNVVRGVTTYEYRRKMGYTKRPWKANVVHALGTRWYWGFLWFLADSPLPEDEEMYDHQTVNKTT